MKTTVVNSWHSGAGIYGTGKKITDWRRERRWETVELKDSTIGDGGQATISLTPDVDGTGSGSLLDSVLSIKMRYCCSLHTVLQ